MAQVHGEVHGHLRHVARAERRVRGDDARHARLRLELLRDLDGLRPEADGELEADGLRVAALDDLEEALDLPHRVPLRHERVEKGACASLARRAAGYARRRDSILIHASPTDNAPPTPRRTAAAASHTGGWMVPMQSVHCLRTRVHPSAASPWNHAMSPPHRNLSPRRSPVHEARPLTRTRAAGSVVCLWTQYAPWPSPADRFTRPSSTNPPTEYAVLARVKLTAAVPRPVRFIIIPRLVATGPSTRTLSVAPATGSGGSAHGIQSVQFVPSSASAN